MATNASQRRNGNASSERITIENNGQWDWSLAVDGAVVSASKLIPHDGARTYSTKESDHSRSSRRRGSQFHLSVEQVVERYHRHSQTDRSKDELLMQVNEVVDE